MQMIVILDLKSIVPEKEIAALYDFLIKNNATRLNDVSFFIQTDLPESEIVSRISRVMNYGDKAHLIKTMVEDNYICKTYELEPGEKERIEAIVN